MKEINSQRQSKEIRELFAIVAVDENGFEGVARRVTKIGTQALVTDDFTLVDWMLMHAQQQLSGETLKIVRFIRENPG